MKNYNFSKSLILPIILLTLILACVSCTRDEKITHPEPSENPVSLNAEAQSKEVYIRHLSGVKPEDPQTD